MLKVCIFYAWMYTRATMIKLDGCNMLLCQSFLIDVPSWESMIEQLIEVQINRSLLSLSWNRSNLRYLKSPYILFESVECIMKVQKMLILCILSNFMAFVTDWLHASCTSWAVGGSKRRIWFKARFELELNWTSYDAGTNPQLVNILHPTIWRWAD